MATIELAKVSKRFGSVETIRGVDLHLNDREFVVFVGPSGCGKSTLLRLIAGLEDVSSGEIRFDNQVVNEMTPPERGIAMVFQSYALYPHMSVYENMMFGLKLAKTDRPEAERRVQEAARILQLDQLLQRKPRELSGGQRQRVAIGRAITRNPKVFLFDEPLSNLDAALRVQMRIEIARLHQRLDATMIYVTHDQVEAMTLADRIVVLETGEVRQVGSPIELYQHPANRFVAGFIGSPRMNFLPASLPKGIAIPPEIVEVGVRPEHLQLGEGGDATIEGRVLTVERLGAESWVYLDLGLEDPVVVKHGGAVDVAVDGTARAGLPAGALYLFDAQGRCLPREVYG
ncbi:ABC transporter ATP-binding protein [Geminicoccus roseus]|uniref:ABC transporter ATP-binding protein n=1 Tax=Geminicoccus roseus TaxID=404900 RepID=UPI0004294DF1|nr:sn-glycerol-3-phosphate ABC transporter ATP-binding protein UgpC [Geminicoccus roseus]